MSNDRRRAQFVSELEEHGDSLHSGGMWNNILGSSLSIVTVLASLVATVLASTDQEDISRWIIAAVAAIPAAAASLRRIIEVRERSNWYFRYAAHVRSLATQLKNATAPNMEEFANRYGNLGADGGGVDEDRPFR